VFVGRNIGRIHQGHEAPIFYNYQDPILYLTGGIMIEVCFNSYMINSWVCNVLDNVCFEPWVVAFYIPKELSVKDVRSQEEGIGPSRTFCGQVVGKGSSDADARTFYCKKLRNL